MEGIDIAKVDSKATPQPTAAEGPLLVIGAGMARTGTMTLKTALETLYGQPCYHMFEIVNKHSEHIAKWIKIFQQKSHQESPTLTELKQLFKGYRAVTDLPAIAIYQDLMKAYPDAKVILTIRDDEKWMKSVRATVRPNRRHLQGSLFCSIVERIILGNQFYKMADLSFLAALGWNLDLSDDNQMKEAFNARNEEVKRIVPADRLLVYEVKEGWKPLCEFLGLPIPEQPFPHVNDTASMQKLIWGIYTTLRVIQVGAVSVCVAGLAFVAYKTGHFSFNPMRWL